MEALTLNLYEAVIFAHYDIVALPAATIPYGWRISYAGVPVVLLPGRFEMGRNIEARRRQMPAWKMAMPRYAATSSYWPAKSKRERKAKLGLCVVYGRPVHPDLRNREGRERFWFVHGRTKYTVISATRREELLRAANNAEIVEIPSDEEDDAGGASEKDGEGNGSGSFLNH